MHELRDTGRDEELGLVVVGGGVAGLFAALCAASESDVLEYEIRQEIVHQLCNQLAHSAR